MNTTPPAPTGPAPALGRLRPRRWPLWLGLAIVLAAGALAAAWTLVEAVNVIPVSLTIDGERVLDRLDLSALPPAHKLGLAVALLFAVLTAVLAVPMALGLVLLALALAVLLPLVIALGALALVTAPVWLLAWALWRALARTPAEARP